MPSVVEDVVVARFQNAVKRRLGTRVIQRELRGGAAWNNALLGSLTGGFDRGYWIGFIL